MARLAYHAINQTGLGHAMRLLAVGTAVREKRPDVHQLFVTEAQIPREFERLGFPSLVLPHDASGPFFGFDKRLRSVSRELSGRLLFESFVHYSPNTVVFDTHFPIKVVRRLDSGIKRVLMLRQTRAEYIEMLIREKCLSDFDMVLVPHEREEFSEAYAAWVLSFLSTEIDCRFVGPIVRNPRFGRISEETERLPWAEGRRVLVTTGGGGYRDSTQEFVKLVLAALAQLRKSIDLTIVIATGPYVEMDRALQEPGVSYVGWIPDPPDTMMQSDIVISPAGYNSTLEIVQAGSRGLLAAARRRHDDQLERVRRIAKQYGTASFLLTDSPTEVAEKIEASIETEKPRPVKFHGREAAAAAISETLPKSFVKSHSWGSPPSVLSFDEGFQCFDLGRASLSELRDRISAMLDLADSSNLPRERVIFTFTDSATDSLLPNLVRLLGDEQFHSLVSKMPAGDATANTTGRIWATIRDLRPNFAVDIVRDDQPVVVVDQ